MVEGGCPFDIEYRYRHKAGHWVWVRNRATLYVREGTYFIDGIFTDITEKRISDENFRQAQRMESIGQLTGGIAHDFNNILAAILANSHFLLEDLAEDDPRRSDALEIKLAADRASALVQQLLAFSRRQVLAPAIVDLNSIVNGIQTMLLRLIGEDIHLSVKLEENPGMVRVDAGQIEQVIVNLAINARDAMPEGGTLRIETSNVSLDHHDNVGTLSVIPGNYTLLTVTDSGCGMDAATLERVFEPFFTTKEAGRGTGLGLSTCYGIIKQSGGYIWASSEVGQGSTFKVYLPQSQAKADPRPPSVDAHNNGGTETVLLVEDDQRVRVAVARMLESFGYRVLVADSGRKALSLASEHIGSIELVLSDVVMPGWLGPEFVTAYHQRFGPSRVLFMSGYSDHAVFRNGNLQVTMNFIQKPFTPEALARKVREVLDA